MTIVLAAIAIALAAQPSDAEAQVNGVLNLFDGNGDRALDGEELFALLSFTATLNNENPDNATMDEAEVRATARTAMSVLDKDGNGKLDRDELMAMHP
ncbi:EF-hand domain-containing protein [Sphingomicrobium aestuariivivum]|uniref:EF-hand domain-containing protein n=1 Tax=Sphingomicrobium aestuariivivum TaxID=1582356 RepID=UPI001FD7000B|nr:EF-hand domain-containing protein [Sphingomicrobium aestuariivivum]MCJ8191062.1 hypothetical protein [Sphingomicrobium aestuariivivum]